MNDFSDWFDNNWVDLARLLVQCGILTVIVYYSRNILKTLRASQEQIGALLRLSVSGGTAHERPSSMEEPALAPPGFTAPAGVDAPRHDPVPTATPAYGFNSHAQMASHVPERDQSLGGRISMERTALKEHEPEAEAPSLTPWDAAPATRGSRNALDRGI